MLPERWCEASIPEVAEINPARPSAAPADCELVTFLPMASVEPMSGRIDTSISRPWGEIKKGYTRFQEGDVLSAKITPCMENGKAAVAHGLSAGVGAGSTEFHVLRAGSALNNYFLLYYILQEEFRRSAKAEMTGTAGQLRVPGRFFECQKIPVPPLPEQHRIVETIESYLTRLDDAMATLERVQRNLKRYRTSVLKAAVEGRLVPTEAELARAESREYEPASVLLERILAERRRRWEEAELAKMKAKGKTPKNDKWKARYVEPAAPDASELPELPEGWCWAGPEQIAAHEKYALGIGPFGSNLKVTDYREEGVPLVFVRNIRADSFFEDDAHYVSVEKAIELKPHIARAGDLLITKMGEPPGDAAIYPFGRPDGVITADCIRLRAHPTLMSTPYLLSAIRSPIFQRQIVSITKGVAQKKVSLERFKLLAIPIAPLSEQYRIAREIDRLLSVRDAALNTVLRQAQRVIRLRQSILKWAFEGRLVNQDPNDEPAEVLLERIRAERSAGNGKKQPRTRRVNTRTASA
jgi:type I restriction enzyme S subunit